MPMRQNGEMATNGAAMTVIAALCGLMICAAGPAAQAPVATGEAGGVARQPSDPPALPSDEQLSAWASHYVIKGAFVQTGFDADRVYLYDPSSMQRLPNGYLLGLTRAELLRPRVVEGMSVRSVRKMVVIDCAALRYKEIIVDGFAGSNLQRPVPGLPVADAWTKPLKEGAPEALRLLQPLCVALKARP